MDLTLRAWGQGYPERRLSTILAGTTSLLTLSAESDEPIRKGPRPVVVPKSPPPSLERTCPQCGQPFLLRVANQNKKLCSPHCHSEWRRRPDVNERANRKRAETRLAYALAREKWTRKAAEERAARQDSQVILPLPPAGATLDAMLARIAAWRASQEWIR